MLMTPEGHMSKTKKGEAVVTPPHNTKFLAITMEAGRFAATGHHKEAIEVMVIDITTTTITKTIITMRDRTIIIM
eukprot:2610224-Ditylum_brightwellii.AAC.1